MCRKRYKPDLIDLDKYWKEIKTQRAEGRTIRPPHTIPGLINGSWTDKEMGAMRENRRKARELYNKVK